MLLKITHMCDMECPHCLDSAIPDGKHMSLDTLNKVCDEIQKLFEMKTCFNEMAPKEEQRWVNTPRLILVSGGEPTQHPDFGEIMKLLGERFNKGNIGVLTNGSRLDNRDIVDAINKNAYTMQLTTDKRFYKKVTTPKMAIDFGINSSVRIEDRVVEELYLQGRAKDNNLCKPTNRRLCSSGCELLKEINSTVKRDDIWWPKHIETGYKGKLDLLHRLDRLGYCTLAINIRGDVILGESNICPPLFHISDSDDVVKEKIDKFKCNKCEISEIIHIHDME